MRAHAPHANTQACVLAQAVRYCVLSREPSSVPACAYLSLRFYVDIHAALVDDQAFPLHAVQFGDEHQLVLSRVLVLYRNVSFFSVRG